MPRIIIVLYLGLLLLRGHGYPREQFYEPNIIVEFLLAFIAIFLSPLFVYCVCRIVYGLRGCVRTVYSTIVLLLTSSPIVYQETIILLIITLLLNV